MIKVYSETFTAFTDKVILLLLKRYAVLVKTLLLRKEDVLMKKRILSILIAASLIICALPVASFAATKSVSVNDKAVVYVPNSEYRSGDCILTSTRSMIRRALIARGSKKWSSVTNKTLRKDATIFGLLWHNFTHNADGLAFNVKCGYFKGKTEKERIKEFQKLIKEHPEGVVVWGKRASIYGEHGILLTGVKNGVPYAADSEHNRGSRNVGIEKWSKTSMYSPLKCTQYWYINKITLAKGAKAPKKGKPLTAASSSSTNVASTLKVSGATIPSSVIVGKPFVIKGVVESNYRITSVNISVVNSNGKSVISQTAKPNTWVYDLSELDYKVRFGTLSQGSYKYKVTVKDEKKTSTLINASFKVVGKPKSSLAVVNYTAPTSIKKGSPFILKGKISSNKKITKVTIQVVDTKGKAVITASSANKSKSFNIAKLDLKVRFGILAKGTYYYRITATDTAQTKRLVNKKFTVK